MVLTLSQAIEQYNRYLRATGKSPRTIADYNNSYRKLRAFFDHDPPIAALGIDDLEAFFVELQTQEVAPAGVAPRPARKLSDKTIKNIHTGLSSLWTWAVQRQFVSTNVIRSIKVNNPQPPPIEAFTEGQIQALIDACEHSRPWVNREETRHRVPRTKMLHDQAVILFLVDTGVRASEACGLTIGDLDTETRTAYVAATDAKNSKARFVKFGRRTTLAVLDYLATRPDSIPNDPFFSLTNRHGRFTEEHFDRRILGRHLRRIGERAGIPRVYPHRFRHTFATQFLVNGGDPGVLQELLGHSTLEMVYRYVHYVEADIAKAHRRASPADNWKLKLKK
jgi:integrase/recombinase XerD